MRLLTAIAAIVACMSQITTSQSYNGPRIYIIGGSMAAHHEYSKLYSNVFFMTTQMYSRANSRQINEPYGWGMFFNQYTTMPVHNLARTGMSGRNMFLNARDSVCEWPVVTDLNNAPSWSTATDYLVQGKPAGCLGTPDAPLPKAGDYVIIQLGNMDSACGGMNEMLNYAGTTPCAAKTNTRHIRYVTDDPRMAIEWVYDFPTYVKRIISSVVCKQTNNIRAGGEGSVIDYRSMWCQRTYVRPILMTDNKRFDDVSPQYLDELRGVVADYNSAMLDISWKMPLIDTFSQQNEYFQQFSFTYGGAGSFNEIAKANYLNSFHSLLSFAQKRDKQNTNYFGAQLNAATILCAMFDTQKIASLSAPLTPTKQLEFKSTYGRFLLLFNQRLTEVGANMRYQCPSVIDVLNSLQFRMMPTVPMINTGFASQDSVTGNIAVNFYTAANWIPPTPQY